MHYCITALLHLCISALDLVMLDLAIQTLRDSTNIAVVGFSRYPGKAAHDIPKLLSSKEFNVVGVNPAAVPVVDGVQVYERLLDVDLDIDIVNVFRPSADTDVIIDQALERNELQGDVSLASPWV